MRKGATTTKAAQDAARPQTQPPPTGITRQAGRQTNSLTQIKAALQQLFH